MELDPINPMDPSNLDMTLGWFQDILLRQDIPELFQDISQLLCCVPSSAGKAGVTEQSSPPPEAGHGSPDPSVVLLALRHSFPPGKELLVGSHGSPEVPAVPRVPEG